MKLFRLVLLLATSVVFTVSSPSPTAFPLLQQALEKAVLPSGTPCTFTAASDAITSKAACATIVLDSIVVPAGSTLDLTKLTKGTNVIFQGNTSFGYQEWVGPLISVSGTNISVSGGVGHVIDGGGARWWDGLGTNGGKTKPKFFFAHDMINSSISGLKIKNTPVQCFSIDGADALTIDAVVMDDSDGDVNQLGHNTDAYDIGSSNNIIISNANVKNQDDCLAINSGTNITFTNGTCSGGHGLSIGSVGGRTDNAVQNVLISSSTISNSMNGVRIKTVSNTTGSVSDITYSDITLMNITSFGIVIEQDYLNGSPTGVPTDGVPITNLKLNNIQGTVSSKATNAFILCATGACSGWTFTSVNVTGGKASSKCLNVPGGSGAVC